MSHISTHTESRRIAEQARDPVQVDAAMAAFEKARAEHPRLAADRAVRAKTISKQPMRHAQGRWVWVGTELQPLHQDPASTSVQVILDRGFTGRGFDGKAPMDVQSELDACYAVIAGASELFEAAASVSETLRAAEKIVRGNGQPRIADVLHARTERLLLAVRRASGEPL